MTRFLTGSSSKPSCEKNMSDKKGYAGSKIKQKVFFGQKWTLTENNTSKIKTNRLLSSAID